MLASGAAVASSRERRFWVGVAIGAVVGLLLVLGGFLVLFTALNLEWTRGADGRPTNG